MEVSRLTINQLPDDIRNHLNKYNLFSSTSFSSLWEEVGGRPVYWVLTDPNLNRKIIAILPGMEFGSYFFKRFQAMADGCYGQVIPIDSNVNLPEAANAILDQISRAGYIKIFINDFNNIIPKQTQFEITENRTRVVNISDSDWMPPDNSLRRAIKKAERETLVVTKFTSDDLKPFLALVDKTITRQVGHTIRYPSSFYRRLAELASKDERIVWRIVYHESTPVASHIYFYEADMLFYWAGFFDINYSHLKANQYMMYQTAKEYALKSVLSLNLGLSPESVDSLDDYKKKWGGELKVYNSYIGKSWLGRLI